MKIESAVLTAYPWGGEIISAELADYVQNRITVFTSEKGSPHLWANPVAGPQDKVLNVPYKPGWWHEGISNDQWPDDTKVMSLTTEAMKEGLSESKLKKMADRLSSGQAGALPTSDDSNSLHPTSASTGIEKEAKQAAIRYAKARQEETEAEEAGKKDKDALAAETAGKLYASRVNLKEKCKNMDQALREQIRNCKKSYIAGLKAINDGDSYACKAQQSALQESKAQVEALFERYRSECGGISLGKQKYDNSLFESIGRGELVQEARKLHLNCREQCICPDGSPCRYLGPTMPKCPSPDHL